MSKTNFVASREWSGETCFILGGGPSVLNIDVQKMRGHKLIAINSSCYIAPWADFLLFSDTRWWDENVKSVTKDPSFNFEGRIICVSSLARHPRLLHMRRKNPPGLSTDPGSLIIKYTSTMAAVNLAVHLGVRKIVLVGIDGKNGGENGKLTHHHYDRPYPWTQKPKSFGNQRKDMWPVAKDLLKLKIECVNASRGSALADIWPIVDYDEMVREDTERVMTMREAAE